MDTNNTQYNIISGLSLSITILLTLIGIIAYIANIIFIIFGAIALGCFICLYLNLPSRKSFHKLYDNDNDTKTQRILEHIKSPSKRIVQIEFNDFFIFLIAMEIDKTNNSHRAFLGIANMWLEIKLLK
jgi:hypothetical protein